MRRDIDRIPQSNSQKQGIEHSLTYSHNNRPLYSSKSLIHTLFKPILFCPPPLMTDKTRGLWINRLVFVSEAVVISKVLPFPVLHHELEYVLKITSTKGILHCLTIWMFQEA